MIDSKQLREFIIRPTLQEFGVYSIEAEELLIATCANESLGGTYLHQIEGSALGIYQMEPLTHEDIWSTFLYYKPDIKIKTYERFNVLSIPDNGRLVYDLKYATLMARLQYYRVKEELPTHNAIEPIYRYYKEHYNTTEGKANLSDFITNYRRFIS